MSEELESGRMTLSMPASRRKEFDSALLKLKQRRPFDSISKIVADAVISTATSMDQLSEEMEDAADVAAYDAAKAAGGDPLPLNEAIAEIERERQTLRKAG